MVEGHADAAEGSVYLLLFLGDVGEDEVVFGRVLWFYVPVEAGTQFEVADDEVALPGGCVEILFLHLHVPHKGIVSDLLDNPEGIDLNIPGSELDIALDQTLDGTSLHKHENFHSIFLGIGHDLASINVPHQLEAIVAVDIRLLDFLDKRAEINFLLL